MSQPQQPPVQAQAKVEEVSETELQPLTAEGLAEIEEQARKDGHAQGFAQGHKEGLAAGQKYIDETLHRLEQIIHAFAEPLDELNEAVEEELIALAMVIARQIIRREIRQDPQHILAVVREAMAELPSNARQVRIFLHPEDAILVRETFVDHEHEDGQHPWKIVDDLALSRGGCRIESQHSRIDASLEKRLTHILATLMGGTRSTDPRQGAEHDDASN